MKKSPFQIEQLRKSMGKDTLMVRIMTDLLKVHDTFLKKLDDVNNTIEKKVGPQGESPTPEALLELIRPLVPTQEDLIDAVKKHLPDVTTDHLKAIITPLIPQVEVKHGITPKKGVDYFTEADQEKIAKRAAEKVKLPEINIPEPIIDHEFIINGLLEKLKSGKHLRMNNINGLEETVRSFSSQLTSKGYIHGGGDTVGAGTGVIISTVNGTKIISAAASSGTPVENEVVSGSGTTFTLAQTPIAGSQKIYANGQRVNVGASNDYTISGKIITFVNGESYTTGTILADYRV